VDGWVRPDAWWPGTNVAALAETAGDVAASRVVRSWRDGDRTVLDMRYLIATADDGFEQEQELHELTLFTDEEYRAAFVAASPTPRARRSPRIGRPRSRSNASHGVATR